MRLSQGLAGVAAASLIGVAACGTSSTGGTVATCTKTFKVGLVTDVGKLSDNSFNFNAWQGVQDAMNDPSLCVKAVVIESSQPSDYQNNLQLFVDQKYDMVVAVGTLLTNGSALSDATLIVAKANPGVRFAIVDTSYTSPPSNVSGLVFREDEAGFLAGIVAAKMSTSGIIGTGFMSTASVLRAAPSTPFRASKPSVFTSRRRPRSPSTTRIGASSRRPRCSARAPT